MYSDLHIERVSPLPGGGVLDMRSLVFVVGAEGADDRQVLDWRFSALMF